MGSSALRLPRADFSNVILGRIASLCAPPHARLISPTFFIRSVDATSAGTVGVDLALVPEPEHLELRGATLGSECQHIYFLLLLLHSLPRP